MKNLILFACTSVFWLTTNAQYLFNDETSSADYKAKITVANYNAGLSNGQATIMLFDKITDQQIQIFSSNDLAFSLKENQDPNNGEVSLGKYQSPLIFDDFNFDGFDDIAIRNGHNTQYNGASFDIYTFNSVQKKFILDAELTRLASNNRGMFDLNKAAKQITIHQKEGCCYYKDITYQTNGEKKIAIVATVIEDATIGDNVTVITQKLINGKMSKIVQTFKTKEYYAQ